MDSSFRHNSTQRPEFETIVKHSKQRMERKGQKNNKTIKYPNMTQLYTTQQLNTYKSS